MPNPTPFTPDQIQHIKAQSSTAVQTLATPEAAQALGASWFACTACKVGFNVVVAAPLAAALALGAATLPEDTALVAVVAEFAGISEAAAAAWIAGAVAAGATTTEEFISYICTEMGACS